MHKILEINNLCIEFSSVHGPVRAVEDLSLFLNSGETLGIAGESGSGKSVTALSVMRLLPFPAGRIAGGQILFKPEAQQTAINLMALPPDAMPAIRGADIAMIFQEPMTSLNPVFRCGDQVVEAIQLHRKLDLASARTEVFRLFEKVRLSDPGRIFNAFPHQLSGGQKQRVMIAMALSCQPKILIADEPTTALDPTVQKATLDLMSSLRQEAGLAMLLISHDLGVLAGSCDRLAIMHGGKIVETGPVAEILQAPKHPYTQGLLACRPSFRRKWNRLPTMADFLEGNLGPNARVKPQAVAEPRRKAQHDSPPILELQDLTVRYPAAKDWLGRTSHWLQAVDQVSFNVFEGETFGIAGESGCGKTTLARAIARLTPASSGNVLYKGTALQTLSDAAMRPYRREIQMIFQDPYGSLNPKMPVGTALTEPMKIHQLYGTETARRDRAINLLETVGLKPNHFNRLPHSFSGGQRQRICIARALAVEPRLLICDEIVSSLDVSVQATILNLLSDLQQQFGLTYLMISHDLNVIGQMCDRLLVMHDGKIETVGEPGAIFSNPETEYVKQLVSAVLD